MTTNRFTWTSSVTLIFSLIDLLTQTLIGQIGLLAQALKFD